LIQVPNIVENFLFAIKSIVFSAGADDFMIPRWQFALDLGSNSIQNTKLDNNAVKHLCRNRFTTASDAERLSAVLASPEFQWA
jgi:hypothetical protein